MEFSREGIAIGRLFIHFYGLLILAGVMAAAWLTERQAKWKGENPDLVWDTFLFWAVIGGIIGARVWHILTPPPSMVERGITTAYYLTHPLDAIAIWNGGLGIPGAVIGGMIAVWICARNKKVNFIRWVDMIAPGLALAQAIGRWGNFLNQELYGQPTTLPWAIFIDPQYRLPQFAQFERYHPLFLYESLWNLLNMAVLLFVGRKYADRLKDGDIFTFYLIIYPVGRFFLDFLRLDASEVAGINANQTLMAVLAVGAIITLIWRHREDKFAAPAAPVEPEPAVESDQPAE